LLTPGVTVPLNEPGTWRANATYTIQEQFAGGGKLAPSSQRFVATLLYDFNRAIKAFVRFDTRSLANPAPVGTQTTSEAIVGVDFTL
jgi:hypothetical protein